LIVVAAIKLFNKNEFLNLLCIEIQRNEKN